jgi:hypothetical protein
LSSKAATGEQWIAFDHPLSLRFLPGFTLKNAESVAKIRPTKEDGSTSSLFLARIVFIQR